ncbi:MAG: chromosomal replication initiator protein DnaA [Candidatus Uhrbacteria bacterium]
MNTEELWQATLGELELQISKANFTTWFKNTFIISFEGSKIYVGVPNTFTKAWLEKKYHKDITSALQNLSSNNIREVTYQVETRQSAPQPVPTDEDVVAVETYMASSQPTMERNNDDVSLNPKYTFSSFVVGKQNELAHAAAQAVSSQPGDVYNPLFIYGGVGLGKTHLLQAIGHGQIRQKPETRVLYVTCEKFTNDFIHAVRTGHAKEFKDLYRNVDILLVDDIQFLTGKEGTQEEFFHTFNALHQDNKQIVLSSDRPPKAIPALENRLLSRFEWGMMADIGSPDFETRIAILDSKCRDKNYLLEREILHHIATVVQSNIRELEGALNKIIAFHQFKNINPTVDSVRPMLASFQPSRNRKNVTPKHLIQTVATYFDITIDEILSKSREKRLAFPRQIIMYIMREEMKSSYPSIGQELGGRDHTTAMHAYDKISNILNEDEKLQHDLELIKQRLYTA